MIQPVIQPPDPRLRTKSKPVSKIDKKIKVIITDLKDTLEAQKDPEGVGLAAPQIGKNVRVFLMKYTKDDAKKYNEKSRVKVIINPTILEIKKVTIKQIKSKKNILEGCLSLPHYYGPLTRSNKVTLSYLSENGEEKTQTFTDFPAQVVLHEIDHLDGVLFVDRIIEQNQKLYEYKNGEWYEVNIV